MLLEIISPDKKIYSGEVDSVVLPGVDGAFGVLKNHAPIVAVLGMGTVKVTDTKNTKQQYDISGGVVEVLNNKVIVLAES